MANERVEKLWDSCLSAIVAGRYSDTAIMAITCLVNDMAEYEGDLQEVGRELISRCLKKRMYVPLTEADKMDAAVTDWLANACEKEEGATESIKDLYRSYSGYATANGWRPLSQKAFGMQMERRGARLWRTGACRYRTGYRLL